MTPSTSNNEEGVMDTEVTSEQYAKAALRYLEYKAKIQQCPAAIQTYEKRQRPPTVPPMPPQQLSSSSERNVRNCNDTSTTVPNQEMVLLRPQNDVRQQPVETATKISSLSKETTTTAAAAADRTTTTATKKAKKRNYGSLFKN
jgi:hypothetical protein